MILYDKDNICGLESLMTEILIEIGKKELNYVQTLSKNIRLGLLQMKKDLSRFI